jgi:ribosomal protein L37AE/L43A
MSTPLEKIKKLQGMLRATGPEAANAQRLINALIEKYKIDPSTIYAPEPTTVVRYKVHRLKKWAMHLSRWMKITCYTIPGAPDYIAIKGTGDEINMFYELLGEVKHIFNTSQTKMMKEAEDELLTQIKDNKRDVFGDIVTETEWFKKAILKRKNIKHYSYMMGYMKGNYPYNPDLCTVCKKGEIEEVGDGKWECPECHAKYTSSGMHNHGIEQSSYNAGFENTTRSLRQRGSQIAYQG